jgi:hypothetical protein
MGLFTTIALPSGYGELPDSPEERFTERGWEATVQLIVPWDLRTDILEDILMYSRPYPHMYGQSGAYAITGSSKPYTGQASFSIGADGTAAQYSAAHLTINYGRTRNNCGHKSGGGQGVEVYSEQLDFTDSHLTLEAKQFCWNHDGADTAHKAPVQNMESPILLVKGFEYTQVRYNQANVPTDLIDLLGSSNASAYYSPLLGITLPAESLLYNPPTLTRKVMSSGAGLWTLSYKLSGKPSGWNKFWNPKGEDPVTSAFTGAWEYQYPMESDTESGDIPHKPYTPMDWSSFLIQ